MMQTELRTKVRNKSRFSENIVKRNKGFSVETI